MPSEDLYTLPLAAKDERSSGLDYNSRRSLKQCRSEDSDICGCDTCEKQKRSRKLKQARQGKKPEGAADDGTKAAESSSNEDCEYHASPIDEGPVDSGVVSQDSKPFSYTGELLPQYEAECLLGAHQTQPAESGSATVMPDTTTRGFHPVDLPHTELEPLEEGQTFDSRSHTSVAGDEFEASERWREGSSWVPASQIVGEPQVAERSVTLDSSEGEPLVEPHLLADAPGHHEGFQAVHGEAVERPNVETTASPDRRAIGPCTLGSEFEMPGPARHPLKDSSQRGSRGSEQPIMELSQEPTETSDQHAVHESANQAVGTTGESSDVSFQNWLEHPDNRANLSRRTSDVAFQRPLGSCGHQVVKPDPHSSDEPGLGDSPHTATALSRQSLDASISQFSKSSSSSSAIQRLKVALWITRVGPVRRFVCVLHEGYSALEIHGVGPNVHWRPKTIEGPLLDWEWPPTHWPGARRWSIGQKSDGSMVGVHIGVDESIHLSRAIYDRRIQRYEMRLVVETIQYHDMSQKGIESLDGHGNHGSHHAGKRMWRFSETVRCCLKNIWMVLCQCRLPSAPPEDGPTALDQVIRPNRPNRQSTATNTGTSLTARDEKSEGSSSDGTLLGSSPRQVSRS